MAEYTLRNTKGSKLTNTEADNNFIASRTTARCNGCAIITPPSGNYVAQSFSSGSMSTVSVGADRLVISPFVLGYDLRVDRAGVRQESSTAMDLRILIYSSTASGRPGSKLYESATIATSSADFYEVSLSHTFTANTLYYVGVHTSGSNVYRSIPREALMPLGGLTGMTTGGVPCALVLTSTAVGSAPNTWSYATSQLQSSTGVPFIGFRAA